MSEYQYYKFMAIDKPISTDEKNIISTWSSRAKVRSSEAEFDYSYGDFPKEEISVVEKYFDLMLYTANWGDVRLIYKFPKELGLKKDLRQFSVDEHITTIDRGNYTILDINFSFDDGMEDCIYGSEIDISALVSLRNDIISGDYSSLYLAWLKLNIQKKEHLLVNINSNNLIPYDNIGLSQLNNSLTTFIELFDINKEIVSNAKINNEEDNDHDYSELLYMMSKSDRINFLDRLLCDEPLLKQKLEKHLRQYSFTSESISEQCRSIAEFSTEISKKREQKRKEEKLRREEQKLKKLEKLEKQEPELWDYIHRLINKRNTKSYDEALVIIKNLNLLAKHKNKQDDFYIKLDNLKNTYSRLSALRRRIESIM